MKKPYYLFQINTGFHEEVGWWLNFIDTFNGKAKMLGHHAPFESVYTDASNWGVGVLSKDDWLVGTFNKTDITHLSETIDHHLAMLMESCAHADINIREMGAVMCAASRWGAIFGRIKVLKYYS